MSKTLALVSVAAILLCTPVHAAQPDVSSERPWLNPSLSPEERAHAAVAAMTLDEKLRLIFGYSDQALTDVAKVSDDIVPADLKHYVVTHLVRARQASFPVCRALEFPIRRRPTHRSVSATASFRVRLCRRRWQPRRASILKSLELVAP